MRLIALTDLRLAVSQIDRAADGQPVDLVVVGGCGVLALAGQGDATRDIDALKTPGLLALQRHLGDARWSGLCQELELNTNADIFLGHLPQDWEDRLVKHPSLSVGSVSVATPGPEDLAVMKVFRLQSKDASDIMLLAGLPGFAPGLFRRLFKEVLPVAIGSDTWHRQSFCMVWNRLFPDNPLEAHQI
jgi:hypothetical protein